LKKISPKTVEAPCVCVHTIYYRHQHRPQPDVPHPVALSPSLLEPY